MTRRPDRSLPQDPCTTLRNRLSSWMDGELDGRPAGQLRRHLIACPACAGHVTGLLAVSRATALLQRERRTGALRAPRFHAVLGRLSGTRRLALFRLVRGVLARRLLRHLGEPLCGRSRAPSEPSLVRGARRTLRDLQGLEALPAEEIAALAPLLTPAGACSRQAAGVAYERLRNLGLLAQPAPPLPSARDPRARRGAVRWARRVLAAPVLRRLAG